jgi:hypothetical protein
MGNDKIAAALSSIGKEPVNYILKDYNVKGAVMGQKPALLIFLMGLFIIFALLSYTVRSFNRTISCIRKACQTDYLSHAAGQYRSEIFKSLVLLILTSAAAIVIWRVVSFSVYIPPEMIPDDLSDISYYSGLIFRKASETFTTDAYTVPFQEIKSNAAEAIFNQIFHVGGLLGLLLLYTGVAGLHKEESRPEKLLLIFGGFLAAALVVFLLLSLLTGLPALVGLKEIIIFWSFIYVNILLFSSNDKKMARETGS